MSIVVIAILLLLAAAGTMLFKSKRQKRALQSSLVSEPAPKAGPAYEFVGEFHEPGLTATLRSLFAARDANAENSRAHHRASEVIKALLRPIESFPVRAEGMLDGKVPVDALVGMLSNSSGFGVGVDELKGRGLSNLDFTDGSHVYRVTRLAPELEYEVIPGLDEAIREAVLVGRAWSGSGEAVEALQKRLVEEAVALEGQYVRVTQALIYGSWGHWKSVDLLGKWLGPQEVPEDARHSVPKEDFFAVIDIATGLQRTIRIGSNTVIETAVGLEIKPRQDSPLEQAVA